MKPSRLLSNARRGRVRALLAALMLGALAASCAPHPDATASAPAAPSPAKTRRPMPGPRAILPDGALIRLELAITPEEIGQGLMFRPSLPDDQGMLFLFEVERVPSFWMKNTLIPLDLVFLDGRGTIVEIIENAQPCKVDPCPQYIPSVAAWATLELSAGTVARHRLAAGDRLRFRRVEGYPRPTG